jgi:hypothetical protein
LNLGDWQLLCDIPDMNPTCISVNDELLVISSSHNHLVYYIDLKTLNITILGSTKGLTDGSPESSQFCKPQGILLEGKTVFVCDAGNNALRLATGIILIYNLLLSSYTINIYFNSILTVTSALREFQNHLADGVRSFRLHAKYGKSKNYTSVKVPDMIPAQTTLVKQCAAWVCSLV